MVKFDFLPIQTKLKPPLSPQTLIQRKQFQSINKLQDEPYQVITLIAPAGYGKSMLMRQWFDELGHQDVRITWLSFNSEDNVPTRFLHCLVAAVQQWSVNLGEKVKQSLLSNITTNFDFLMDNLLNEMWDMDENYILFFDDVHILSDPTVIKIFTRLIHQSPPNVSYIIASREQPKFKLTKLKIQNLLLSYDISDMQFSMEETEQFCNHLRLSTQLVRQLYLHTEGWVAALQLCVLALSCISDHELFINNLSGHDKDITDYLSEIVFDQQSKEIKSFLLSTSMLEQLSGDICNAVTNASSSQTVLEKIEALNLFIIPLDRERKWYRYHGLFKTFLLRKLEKTDKEKLMRCYQAASQWCANNGFKNQAVHYAIQGKDIEKASQLLTTYVMDLIQMQGDHSTLLRWVSMLPKNMLEKYPMIRLGYIAALLFLDKARDADVEIKQFTTDLSETNQPQAQFLLPYILMLHGLLYIFSGRPSEVKELLGSWQHDYPQTDPMLAAMLNGTLAGVAVFSYEFDDYQLLARESLDVLKRLPAYYAHAMLAITLANISMIKGELNDAKDIFSVASDAVKKGLSKEHHGCQLLSLYSAEVSYEQGDVSHAKQTLEQTMHVLEQHTTFICCLSAYRTLTRIYFNQADIANAIAVYEKVTELSSSRGWLLMKYLVANECVAHFANNNNADYLSKWLSNSGILQDSIEQKHNDPIVYRYVMRVLSLIKLRLAYFAENYNEAMNLLTPLETTMREFECKRDLITLLCIKAKILSKLGHEDNAMMSLREALMAGQNDHYIQRFVEEGEQVELIIREHFDEFVSIGLAGEYLNKILQRFSDRQLAVIKSVSQTVENNLFTPKEFSILQLLDSELYTQQIADALVVSNNTLKWHLRNIYRKLNARNRSGAVVRARQLGVIEASE